MPHFAGRAAELKQLTGLLDRHRDGAPGAMQVAVIHGTAGVGKTTLAVRWAHQAAGRFPDGQLYVNLRGFDPAGPPVPPGQAIEGFLEALSVPAGQLLVPAGRARLPAAGRGAVRAPAGAPTCCWWAGLILLGIAVVGSIVTVSYRSHLRLAGVPATLASRARGSFAVASQNMRGQNMRGQNMRGQNMRGRNTGGRNTGGRNTGNRNTGNRTANWCRPVADVSPAPRPRPPGPGSASRPRCPGAGRLLSSSQAARPSG